MMGKLENLAMGNGSWSAIPAASLAQDQLNPL
jgi:hypothetical protein